MALHATIFKVELEVADIDRGHYATYPITMARHPSETDERLLVRLLAFALNVPEDGDHGPLEFARDLWEADEPALWQKDFTGDIVHWIEIGEPSEKRLLRVCARVGRVCVYSYSSSAAAWWRAIEPQLTRARNLSVWQIPAEQSAALALFAQRTMQLTVTVQEGGVWVSDSARSVEVTPIRLRGPLEPARP